MGISYLPFAKPSIDEATIAAVVQTLRSGWITSGPKVQEFEKQLSEYFGERNVRVYNSGTCTLEIALRIAGIGPGDEVITTPLSWVASANVILQTGAKPVFVDIDPATRNIDLHKIAAAITPRTRAILPVDLAGLPVDRDALYALAHKYHLRVIEDAAQSLGARWKDQRIGSRGDFISISFQANKNITCAEGGCLVLPEKDLPEARAKAEKYRLQGLTRTGFDGMEVDLLGGKFNMTDIAASIGLGQLAQIDKITTHRRRLAQHYFACFGASFEEEYGVQLPLHDPRSLAQSNWHLFQIVLPEHYLAANISRATFMEAMHAQGIGTGCRYPPIHLFKLYQAQGFTTGMFPVAERIGRLIVTLPLFFAMTCADVERVVEAVTKSLSR